MVVLVHLVGVQRRVTHRRRFQSLRVKILRLPELQLHEVTSILGSPPGLIASLLEGLPHCERTLKSMHIALTRFDASATPALVRVVPHLCLDNLTLVQYNQDEDTDRENVPVILRAILNGELSLTSKLHRFVVRSHND